MVRVDMVLVAVAGLAACTVGPEVYAPARTPVPTPTSARLPDMTNKGTATFPESSIQVPASPG